VFALGGRIGRVRWIGYLSAGWTLALAFCTALVALVRGDETGQQWIGGLFLAAAAMVLALVSLRRLQDLGLRPRYLALAIIPVANFYFLYLMLFKRGDAASNNYGPAPSPNNRAAYLCAAIVPAVVVAMMALRAYDTSARSNATSAGWQRYSPK
jgi:uncharacterized membrane protein YhaH (DUF805 family)